MLAIGFGLTLVVLFGGCRGAPQMSFVSKLPETCPITVVQDAVSCDGDKDKCETHCRETLGSNYVGASCEGARCSCIAPCAIGGTWGDPHVWSFDGVQFGFDGVCSYTMAKMVTPNSNVPNFHVVAQDKKIHEQRSRSDYEYTVADNVQIIITDWSLDIRINSIVQVNGKEVTAPLRINGPSGHYIKISESSIETDSDHMQSYYVQSSFGLQILFEKSLQYPDLCALYVILPKTADFLGNVVGILGQFDGDANNDCIDANGIRRDIHDPTEMEAFGNSFCVGPHNALDDAMGHKIVAEHKARMTTCQNDPAKIKAMTDCEQLNRTEFVERLGQDGVNKIVDACRMDSCFAGGREQEKTAICAAHNVANMMSHLELPCQE